MVLNLAAAASAANMQQSDGKRKNKKIQDSRQIFTDHRIE